MEEEKARNNDWSRHHRTRPVMAILLIVGIFVVIGLVFAANGHRRASTIGFNNHFGNYPRKGSAMRGRIGPGMRGTAGRQGSLGSVSAINGSSFTLHASAGDTSVSIASTTSLYKNGVIAKQSDLKVGDVVTVFGAPGSDGTIQARLIQIN